jgi:hypothetical protein
VFTSLTLAVNSASFAVLASTPTALAHVLLCQFPRWVFGECTHQRIC